MNKINKVDFFQFTFCMLYTVQSCHDETKRIGPINYASFFFIISVKYSLTIELNHNHKYQD